MEEYICKNSVRLKPISAKLFEHYIEVGGSERSHQVEYNKIESVQLSKRGDFCKMIVHTIDKHQFIFSNRFYLASGQYEDRSRHYVTFVRIFHFYLRDNSTIIFKRKINWLIQLLGGSLSYEAQSIPLEMLPTIGRKSEIPFTT